MPRTRRRVVGWELGQLQKFMAPGRLGLTRERRRNRSGGDLEGPAFHAGLTAGSKLESVDGRGHSQQVLGDAIEAAASTGRAISLSVTTRSRPGELSVDYCGGRRFPHLEPIPGSRLRLTRFRSALTWRLLEPAVWACARRRQNQRRSRSAGRFRVGEATGARRPAGRGDRQTCLSDAIRHR